MKEKFKQAYMDTALRFAELSTAVKLKVGSIIVKDDRIISIGYNGTPSGWDNICETKNYMPVDAGGWLDPEQIKEDWPYEDENRRYNLKTKPEVLHAEANALMKLAKSSESGDGATLFITHSPCIDCAKMIYQAGIKEVYYCNQYRSNKGIEFLKQCNVHVECIC